MSVMEEAFIEMMETDMSCQDVLIDCIEDENPSKESNYHLLLNDNSFEELSPEYHVTSGYKECRIDLKVDTDTIFVDDFLIKRKADQSLCFRNATLRPDISRNMHTDQVDTSENQWTMSKEFKEPQQSKNSLRENVIEEDADLWELIESLNETDDFSGGVNSFDYALDLIEPTLEKLDSNIIEKYSHIFSQKEMDIMEENILDSQNFLDLGDSYDRKMLTKCNNDSSFDFCNDLDDFWEDDFIDIEDFFQVDKSFTEIKQHTSFKSCPTLSDSESMASRPVSDTSFTFSDAVVTSDVPLFTLPDPLFRSSDPVTTNTIPQLKSSDPVFRITDPVIATSDQLFTVTIPLLTASSTVYTSSNPIDQATPPFKAFEPVFTATVPLVTASNPIVFNTTVTSVAASDSVRTAPAPLTLVSDPVSTIIIPLVTPTACDPLCTATAVVPTHTDTLTASDPVFTATTMPLLTASNHFLTHYSHNGRTNSNLLAKPKSVNVLNDNGQSIMMELKLGKIPNSPRDLNHLKLTNETPAVNIQSNPLQPSSSSSMTRVDPDSYQNVPHIPVLGQYSERSPIDKSNHSDPSRDKSNNFDPSRCECPRINIGMGNKFVSVRIRDILYKNVKEMADCFREKQHKNVNELTKEWKETYKLLRERKIKRLNSEKTSFPSSSNS